MSTSPFEPERPRDEGDPDVETRRRGVNVGHLVMGVAFLGLVVVWALLTSDTVELENSGWILGLPWLIGGAVGLLVTVFGRRRPQPSWKQDWKQDMHAWKQDQKRAHHDFTEQVKEHARHWGHGSRH